MANDTKAKKTEKRRFTTPPFALSYPHLFVAQKASNEKGAKASYSCSAIWRPELFGNDDMKKWTMIHAEIVRVCSEAKWPNGAKYVPNDKAKLLMTLAAKDGAFDVKKRLATINAAREDVHAFLQKKFPQSAKTAVRSGGDERPDKNGYGDGTWFANLRTDSPPGVVDLSKSKIHPSEGNGDEIYPGAICRATISIFAYPNGGEDKGGRGYSFGLGNVQKIKDGERLDSRVAAEDDFDEEVDGAWLDEGGEGGGDEADDAEDSFE